jgi:hypothetical protein
MAWKLIKIEKSDRAFKKYMAHFGDAETGQKKTVHFGASGYEDFTTSKDPERAENYRTRHARDLKTDEAKTGMSPGALAYYVLWTSPSFAQGIRNFKNRYHL